MKPSFRRSCFFIPVFLSFRNVFLRSIAVFTISFAASSLFCGDDSLKNALFSNGFYLPDTGQAGDYTAVYGEDSDFALHTPSFTDNGDGTVTDNNTGLMWQQADGGELTIDAAESYCGNLTLGGHDDWRLPTGFELFGINDFSVLNPAMNTGYFPKTAAEYWWSSERRADDPARVWVVNAGGGIGPHPQNETLSAGGMKRFHVRAVRTAASVSVPVPRFTDNGDGTTSDNYTGLVRQNTPALQKMTWEEALHYSAALSISGKNGWRLPNVRELQSLNDASKCLPSIDTDFFKDILSGTFWSSTTLIGATTKAWDLNVDYGIVSYSDKTSQLSVICVSGGL